jgi:integrase
MIDVQGDTGCGAGQWRWVLRSATHLTSCGAAFRPWRRAVGGIVRVTTLTPQAFAKRWGESTLSERSSHQQHFLDLCEMLAAPKTKGNRRSVTLSQTASVVLRGHLERQLGEDRRRRGPLWRENGLMFASEVGEPLDRRYVTTHLFKPLLDRPGLPRVRFHGLRRSCATLLMSKNVNPKVAVEMLDHASMAITPDTHGHVLPDEQESAAKAMEEVPS